MGRAGSRRHPARRYLRSWQFAALVGAVGALAAAGCSSSSTSGSTGSVNTSSASAPASAGAAPGNATSGTVNWWASPINTSGTDVRTVLISDFEKAYPNIHVSLTSAPTSTDTNRATLVTDISGGSSTPDVFMGDVIWPAQFGAHQLAVPLSNYLPQSYWAQFAPGLVQGATYNSKIYGSPLFEDQGFLYYRKDLLTKENLPVPKTWEQLVSDSETLQKAGLVKYGYVWQGASYEGLTCNYMEFLTDAGGTPTNTGYTSASLNSAASVKAVTFMRSLVTTGVSPAAVSTFQEAQAMSTFGSGQAAFLRNWDYAYATSQVAGSPTVGKVGVAPLPTFAGQSYPGYSNIGGWNLYINPHSKNIAADLTFIKWMASTQAQTDLATVSSSIPTVESVRTSPAIIAKSPVLATVPQTRLIPRPAGTPNYPQLSSAIYQNVNAALAGSTSPSAALGAAQSAANTALSSSAGGL
ncbi:MAG TPA: ABC transporter substrate-binding protein [Streptosporangiaceae bacterium]|jgi:multiple sugar transport system substrate-binding protein|nr:ABC transporter substrate-binding protein [Streptosporangiaceae bacterium]